MGEYGEGRVWLRNGYYLFQPHESPAQFLASSLMELLSLVVTLILRVVRKFASGLHGSRVMTQPGELEVISSSKGCDWRERLNHYITFVFRDPADLPPPSI
ncbi:hypothetical protein OIU76_030150 [Salix suchowensis]|nr:hypothetical protein OIU76_030150 [Salix suchowensis]